MADGVEVKVDTRQAQLKLKRVTPAVRNALRNALPPLIRQLASLVESKLDSELASRKSLNLAQEIHDVSDGQIYGVVRLQSSAPNVGALLPSWLELGTQDHWVAPVNAKALHWTENGEDFFSKGHWVRGIGPYRFLERSLDEMRADVIAELKAAAKLGASQA